MQWQLIMIKYIIYMNMRICIYIMFNNMTFLSKYYIISPNKDFKHFLFKYIPHIINLFMYSVGFATIVTENT